MEDYKKNLITFFITYIKLGITLFPYALCLLILAPLFNSPEKFFAVWLNFIIFITTPIALWIFKYLITKGKKNNAKIIIKPSIKFISSQTNKIFWLGISLFYLIALAIIIFIPIYRGHTIFFLLGGTFFILPGTILIYYIFTYFLNKSKVFEN